MKVTIPLTDEIKDPTARGMSHCVIAKAANSVLKDGYFSTIGGSSGSIYKGFTSPSGSTKNCKLVGHIGIPACTASIIRRFDTHGMNKDAVVATHAVIDVPKAYLKDDLPVQLADLERVSA